MHFSWALCFWLLATLPPQVLSVQIQDVITGSGGVIEAAKKTYARWLDLDFGGKEHGVDKRGDQTRPEAVKMQVCEEPLSKCSECTTQASCWRGNRNTVDGRLKLDVPASATANYYAAEMWASCGSGNGIWSVVYWPDTIVNGVLKIFVDGSLKHTLDGSSSKNVIKMEISITKNTRVRVLFERSTEGQAASARVKLLAKDVDDYVDECMGVTNCLVSLGDGSDSAFDFRNSNVKQLECLAASSAGEQDAVSDHCLVWATCVSTSGIKSKLKALLGAALTSRVSLAEGKINMQKSNDAEGCVDPSVEDPESWDCECMDEMTASCNGVNEECFHKLLCENTNVCESWKGAHCAEFLLAKQKISIQASQNKSAALMRRVAKRAIATVNDRLDSALSGKCAE